MSLSPRSDLYGSVRRRAVSAETVAETKTSRAKTLESGTKTTKNGSQPAPVNVQPTTDEVTREGRALNYEVEVAPGVTFLEVPESDETQDYKPPNWLLDEDEAPLKPGPIISVR
ncbi:hypothetical protein HPB47_012091 [Ixodes persulcatus]|uniref:Uncharacterized protein n=1 Tax=Ixodes persulcatus TaxID=34615 RepID=A0AC60NUN1_IXOPE|nr:hypothetical protein HPB47_012091 [Ixodes persulcatus]